MIAAVTPVPILEATPAATPPVTPADRSPPPSAANESEPLLRLVIEETERGEFVYKTLDRLTGEVVKQIPREEVLKLGDTEAYAPGDVADVQA